MLFGGIGDRFDHTLANAHYLLSLLKKGVRARLVDDKNCVEVIDQHLTLHGKVGDLVSTLPLSMEVTGITLKGFSYPLTDATLTLDAIISRSAMYWRRKPQRLTSRAAIFM